MEYEYTEQEFWEKIIVPSYWGMARQDIIFTLHDVRELLVITSDKYAKELGFNSFKDSMFTEPGIDYKRLYDGNKDNFNMLMRFLNEKKKPFDYIYKKKDSGNQIYLSTTEAIFDLQGNVIGKREIARPIQLVSHRHIVESHFKRHGTNIAALQNINHNIPILNEKEELIMFMLIAGYSQSEIGEYMQCSRSYIAKLIAENLCPKFGISFLSTKLLIDKAISIGFALLIPDTFLHTLNSTSLQKQIASSIAKSE